jgi:hypothetical protein
MRTGCFGSASYNLREKLADEKVISFRGGVEIRRNRRKLVGRLE